MGLVILLIDETGSASAFPILPIGSWRGQAPNPHQTRVHTRVHSTRYNSLAENKVAAEGRWWVLLLRSRRSTWSMARVECGRDASQAPSDEISSHATLCMQGNVCRSAHVGVSLAHRVAHPSHISLQTRNLGVEPVVCSLRLVWLDRGIFIPLHLG